MLEPFVILSQCPGLVAGMHQEPFSDPCAEEGCCWRVDVSHLG